MQQDSNQPQSFSFEELLRFYQMAGVDAALDETPVNHFAIKPTAEQSTHNSAAISLRADQTPQPASDKQNQKTGIASVTRARPAQTPAIHIPNEQQVENARIAARSAKTLEELRQNLENFDGCPLKFTAKNTCFADGTPGAAIMVIGEAPGRDEDLQGLPFVGHAGQLLDRMLYAIGLQRSDVYIANTIAWRPPGNRTPTPLEAELCRPFLNRQIELANPKFLIALGGPATKTLTGAKEGILRLRGNWKIHQTSEGKQIPVMPTLHPAYLLRTPSHKKFAWNDFLTVKMRLKTGK